MEIILRRDKEMPLTIDEMDDNFLFLDRRIRKIEESNIVEAEGISNIRLEADQLIIHGTRGSIWGPFCMPKFVPRLRGDWMSGKDYLIGDWVYHNKKTYMCGKPHTSISFEEEYEKWQLVIEARDA